jgi:WD40 repeat protein
MKNIVAKVAARFGDRESLQDLPPELLVGIAGHFLESPVWHLCKLGETSEDLSKIFNDEALWQGFFETRFREASRSPSRRVQRSRSPKSARQMYAECHMLEMRFREGLYHMQSTLDNHKGVAVLDLRIAPGFVSSSAFAALRDGSIMVYDLDPASTPLQDEDSALAQPVEEPQLAKPQREFRGEGGGPALCCLPLELPTTNAANSNSEPPLTLTAGYASGRLQAWHLPTSDHPMRLPSWEQAHAGRVSALAALGDGALLSAAADGLVKAWDIGGDRFGDLRQIFSGHTDSVVSVAASPFERQIFLTGSHDHTMRLWDVRQGGAESAVVAVWRGQDWVTCVDFHPTSANSIFSSDKSVHTWDVRMPGSNPLNTPHRHRKLVSRFRVDPLRLASCSLDGCVKVSSLEDPGVRRASPHTSPVSSPSLRPVPHASLNERGLADNVCTLRTSTDYVLSIDFDATRLLAGGADGRVRIYDFSVPGSFRMSSPTLSPLAARCGQSVDVDFQLSGMQEIEV